MHLADTHPPVVCLYIPRKKITSEFTEPLGETSLSWDCHASTYRLLANDRSPTAEGVTPGAVLVLGARGPNARVTKDGWRDSVLAHVALGTITQVTAGPDQDARVTFTTFFLGEDVHGGQLDPHLMEALRLSANYAGRPAVPANPWLCLNSLLRLVEHYPALPSPGDPGFTDLVRLIVARATTLSEPTAP